MPGAAAQVGHVLIDIHRVTREASRVARHEFVGLAWRGVRPVRRRAGCASFGAL
ncbi:hypothetical protein BURMUCF2_0363 [Burkholderia multivorans CF2]|nr:hypothetical protein BURMUCF2_0363 [Burkholderia multivorans CF2]